MRVRVKGRGPVGESTKISMSLHWGHLTPSGCLCCFGGALPTVALAGVPHGPGGLTSETFFPMESTNWFATGELVLPFFTKPV